MTKKSDNMHTGAVFREFSRWVKKAHEVKTPEEADRLNKEATNKISQEPYRGYVYRARIVQDIHPADGILECHPFTEIYVENIERGIRLSYFFQGEDDLVGRAYYDKGDIPANEVRAHLSWFDNLIIKGRPKKGFSIPLSDPEIYDLIITRSDWCTFEDPGSSKRITIQDAIDRLIYKYRLIDEDEELYEGFVRSFRLAYDRERRRRRQK